MSVFSFSNVLVSIAICASLGDSFVNLLLPSRRPMMMLLQAENKLTTIEDQDAVIANPIAFLDPKDSENVIMCYVDAVALIDNVEYSVGYPCNHPVDVAYADEEGGHEDGLVPLESDDPLLDELFPMCKYMLEEEYPFDLTLCRTPATLTVEGDLGIEEDADDEGDDEGAPVADVLLTLEHKGKEYKLVRPTDSLLLVGKEKEGNMEQRTLLDDKESDVVMPTLMEMLGI
mmetsp:Transcript_22930/g.33842  ORF Transcript_22930/g.33842 Transcript_22930/m.33842 type:complete len:230 (+) Transcript_22930:127-816(+)